MTQIKKNKLNILKYFTRRYPLQSINLLLIQFGTGLLEGLGVAALFPLIDSLINNQSDNPSQLQKITQQAFEAINLDMTLGNILLVIVVLFTLKAAFRYIGALYTANLSSKIVMDFRENLIKALLGSSWPFYIKNPTGYFTNALMLEAQRSGGAYRTLADIFAAFLQIIILGVLATIVAWQVMVAGLLASAVLWGVLYRFIKQTGRAGLEQKDTSKAISADITDLLSNYKPLKTMHIEAHVFDRIGDYIHRLFVISKKQIIAKQSMNIFHEPIFIVMLCAGLYLMITFMNMETAVLMVLAAIFYRFITAWRMLQQGFQVLTGQESFFWSFQDFTQEAQHAKEEYTKGQAPELSKEITFQNVGFSYNQKNILSDLNISFPVNQLIALYGPSGTGKTTILDLICRLYTPKAGQILIDGKPLNDLDLYLWRDSIGYVPQEFVIFNESLLHNITLGDESIGEDNVIAALKKAEAWDFVQELSDGLNTNLGEKGGKLSGGQRQRISIARALARNPKVLILDEATASLDPKTELEIITTLKALTRDMTIIAVSHQGTVKEQSDKVIDLGKMLA